MGKVCAGRGCSKDGIHTLTIIHLNRQGWFCDSCKNDLVSEGLIIESKGLGHHSQNQTPNADVDTNKPRQEFEYDTRDTV